MKSFKRLALVATTTALLALPTLAPAQTAAPAMASHHTVTVSGAITHFGAGVVVLASGQTIHITSGTKLIGPMPTMASLITVTGTPGDKGNITALTIQIKK